MDNYIPVITKSRRPLAPCHPQRAHSLVRQGKASFRHKRGIRYIILHKPNVPKVKNSAKLQLRIDPGAKETGLAITREHPDDSRSALMVIETQHRGKTIKTNMVKRNRYRRNRRYRKTRYRQPRFNNRKTAADWLPPSLLSRMQNTLTWVRRLSTLLPITEIHVETNKFDPQLLRNPDIKGVQYQQGPCYEKNLRSAVLERDGNKCVYCGKSGKRNTLEMEHVVPRVAGGTDHYDNIVASCVPCNRRKDNLPLAEFLKRRPKKLAEIQAKLGKDLASAAHMNVILPRLLTELRNDGWTVVEHSAATTYAGRIVCGIEKTHHGDAAVTGCPNGLRYLPDAPIIIRAVGRGQRKRIKPDRKGTPRGKPYREYCRLPRHIQKQTLTPGHKKRAKRVQGFATRDYVRFDYQEERIHCYCTISNEKIARIKPKWIAVKPPQATVVERYHGYRIHWPN